MRNIEITMETIAKNMVNEMQEKAGCSQKQESYIKSLCEQRGIKADYDKMFDSKSASDYIQELYKIPRTDNQENDNKDNTVKKPISDKQKNRIQQLCEELHMKEPDYDKLDGSYNGTASKLIQKLMDASKKLPSYATEKQVAQILRMQLCPDCTVSGVLTEEDITKMSKQDASAYIAKHSTDYYAWTKTRLAPAQLKEIERLLKLGENEFHYEAIIQLTPETASAYIEQLNWELKTMDKTSTLEPEIEDIRVNLEVDEETLQKELNNLIHGLYAQIGQQAEEIGEMTQEDIKDLIELVDLMGGDSKFQLENAPHIAARLDLAV